MIPLTYKDCTLKAVLRNTSLIKKKLIALYAEFIGEDNQTDYYFECLPGKLKWRQGNIENLITHYERAQEGPIEQTRVYRYDLNPTKEQIEFLFVNYKNIGVVKKTRSIYILKNMKIHIDQLPTQKEFIEIEAIDRYEKFSSTELKEQCLQLLSRLQISTQDLIPTGYLSYL